ncbi:unnamed protein product [marine sediment metagenome]|uniref:Uncharacterized protein n=1 Tax=marine sediment metagenome TaxID=412755 RepID=X1F010_9ZZZZ
MGLDPTDPDYEADAECGCFDGTPWNAPTPRFVFVSVSGVVPCEDYEGPVPNGVHMLEQLDTNSCAWFKDFPGFWAALTLAPNSVLQINASGVGQPIVFRSDVLPACRDVFANIGICYTMPWLTACHGGMAVVTWGPDIPCGGP